MPKIVILEGMRATGKTTLADHLVEKLGFSRLKFERGEDPWVDMMTTLTQLRNSFPSDRYVIDRFHLTEFVYSLWDGRSSVYTLSRGMDMIKAELVDLDVLTLYVYCPPETMYYRLAMRDGKRSELDIPYREAKVLWQIALRESRTTQCLYNKNEDAKLLLTSMVTEYLESKDDR